MRTDRYILSQFAGYFLFFLAAFACVIWLNRALKYLDFVLENGQAGADFAGLAILLLPNVLVTVVPVAGFAASVAATHKLYSDSELVAMMGAGISNAALMRPFVLAGFLCFVVVSLFSHFVSPQAFGRFLDLQERIRSEYLAQFIVEGEFVFPSENLVFFFGQVDPGGELTDILIRERTDKDWFIIHTAPRGELRTNSDTPHLLLVDGMVQNLREEDRTLGTVQFDSLAFDLTRFASSVGSRTRTVRETSTTQLLRGPPANADGGGGDWHRHAVVEGHGRVIRALLAFLAPIIGVSALLVSGYSRAGFLFRILLAIALMLAINSLRGVIDTEILAFPAAWPLLYVPALAGTAAVVLLASIGISRWRWRWSRIEDALFAGRIR
ncbi:MAG: LptF/LptG family permease [Paracoccaceae bacterium]|nr:LptF/LptG family permease [Paracoccaceae bacterium]MDE2911841.1 LptF/LptG family permease [Paracoccaceae bacterium]